MSQKDIFVIKDNSQTTKYKAFIWTIYLSAIVSVGALLAFMSLFKDDIDISGYLLPSIMLAAAIICCVSACFLKEKWKTSWILFIIPWLIWFVLYGISNTYDGFRIFVNEILSSWNAIHSTGIVLFNVSFDTGAVAAFSVFTAIAVSELTWLFICRSMTILSNLLGILLVLMQLATGHINLLSCALIISGGVGIILASKREISFRKMILSVVFTFALCGTFLVIDTGNIEAVDKTRSDVKQTIHNARYGNDTLPAGNLKEADTLNQSSEEMLKIQTQQEKDLYLKGFVGSDYDVESGSWKPLTEADYGYDNTGLFEWLKKQNFDPLTQTADYYNIGNSEREPEVNKVKINVSDASRSYIYVPSSLRRVVNGRTKEYNDMRLLSKGITGIRSYEIEEVSNTRPNELLVADEWLSSPETDEQKQYVEAEAVYRNFVYDNYTRVDSELYKTIQDLFWNDYTSENDGIYSAVTYIRETLSQHVNYSENGASDNNNAADSNNVSYEPLGNFLTGTHTGNSMMYASAAVVALRVHGIPARYVEGYYVSSGMIKESRGNDVSVTGKNAHAWVEIYFDGIGWQPVEVTPGYYYDAVSLKQMINVPEMVHKTAALNDNDDKSGQEINSDKALRKPLNGAEKIIRNTLYIVLGIIAVIFILIAIIISVMEVMRVICIYRIRRKYKNASQEYRLKMLEQWICNILAQHGIDVCLGWNTEEIDKMVAAEFADIDEGEYTRVCELLEKEVYGREELQVHEERTLRIFLNKITYVDKVKGIINRLKKRYSVIYKKI